MQLSASKKVHSSKTQELSVQPNIRIIKSRRMKKAGYVAQMREMRSAYRLLVGKPEAKRALARSGRRMEDNIKINLKIKGL
jgi:hypothetical protein